MITLNITNQLLSMVPLKEEEKIIADSRNYLKMCVNFPAEWCETLNFALFTHKGKTYKKYFGVDEGLAVNEMFVPPEVIKAKGFTVSLCGGNLITTNAVNVPVHDSGYTENIVNQTATPSVMEQMNKLMAKYATLCNNILKDCNKIKEEINGGEENEQL